MRKVLIGLVIVLLCCGYIVTVQAKTNEETYQERLNQLKPDDVSSQYNLGLWCEQNKLPEQAQAQFEKVIELNPNHTDARKKLGHIKYKDKWQTPDELKAQGLEFYKGKWIPYEEAMKVQGYVKFDELWITSKERDFAVKLNKLYPWTGVIDKPGADSENLPWEKARVKETDHFIVKTNLSSDALNDMCFQLEYMYFIISDFLGFHESKQKSINSKEKLIVSMTKNRNEFEKIFNDLLGYQPETWVQGQFCTYSETTSHKDEIVIYYSDWKGCLLHELSHYVVILVGRIYVTTWPNPPIWLWEGLPVYFEFCKVDSKKLVANLIHQSRLTKIKNFINNNKYIALADFINLPTSKYDIEICYSEGWSLVYFLINGKAGEYKQKFRAYIEAWKNNKIIVSQGCVIQDKNTHLKLFEECMGVPIDQLEQEWKEYILQLK